MSSVGCQLDQPQNVLGALIGNGCMAFLLRPYAQATGCPAAEQIRRQPFCTVDSIVAHFCAGRVVGLTVRDGDNTCHLTLSDAPVVLWAGPSLL